MHRLQLAKQSYQALTVTIPYGADETTSDALEGWLEHEVCGVVEQLQVKPRFRRTALAAETLYLGSTSPERQQLQAVADALVGCAQALVQFARQANLSECLTDHDAACDLEWVQQQHRQPGETRTARLDSRSVVEKLAERPWFDLVGDQDYFSCCWDPGLDHSDPLLLRQYRRDYPNPPLLGDLTTHTLRNRIGFWEQRLENTWQRLSTHPEQSCELLEPAFAAKIHLDQTMRTLRESWLREPGARLRQACCILLQTYVAYHPCPQLPWTGMTSEALAVRCRCIRSGFRRRGTVREVIPLEGARFRQVGTREARIMDMQLVRQVAAALDAVTELYEQDIHPEDLINEAREQYRLTVVRNPKMVFWNGVKLQINWDKKTTAWDFFEQLAVRGQQGQGVDRCHLSGSPSPHAFSGRLNRLHEYLHASGETRKQGEELAARITGIQDGRCRLDLEPREMIILNLETDAWVCDPAEFNQTTG